MELLRSAEDAEQKNESCLWSLFYINVLQRYSNWEHKIASYYGCLIAAYCRIVSLGLHFLVCIGKCRKLWLVWKNLMLFYHGVNLSVSCMASDSG